MPARIINELRKMFPNKKWSYDLHSFVWHTPDYRISAYKVAMSAPKYGGDDDSYQTMLKIVIDSDPPVVLLKDPGLF